VNEDVVYDIKKFFKDNPYHSVNECIKHIKKSYEWKGNNNSLQPMILKIKGDMNSER
jgi:hypothetical protein